MKHLTLTFLALCIIATACKKKKDDNTPANTSQSSANAISGTWKIAYLADDENENFTLDEIEKYPPDTTIFLIFKTDGTGTLTSDLNSPQSGGGMRWSTSDKVLNILFQEDDGSWDPDNYEYFYISSLTATEMIWQDEPDSASFFIGLARQ